MTYEKQIFEGIRYLIRYPDGYDPTQKYPVILFLHGSGTRGTNLDLLAKNDYLLITEQAFDTFPFITVAPQCHEDSWVEIWERLKRLTEEIVFSDFCDKSRFYALGVSMGGYGAWQLAISMPWCFAAIAPICGGGMAWNAHRLKNVPIWAFHGDRDTLVPPEESIRMVEAVRQAGGDARLTLYPGVRHESWINAFSDYALFDWLLSHQRGEAPKNAFFG